MRTVALIGASGTLGSPLLEALQRHHHAGDLALVVLARESSSLTVPAGVERRALDLTKCSAQDVQAALKGVDILISATRDVPKDAGMAFLQHLASLQKCPIYVPSWFTANWTEAERANASNPHLHGKATLLAEARKASLPVTTLTNGLFEKAFFLAFAFGGVDAPGNRVQLLKGAKEATMSISSLPYLAEATAQIVSRDDFAAGQNWTVSEIEFTGSDLIRELGKLHGKEPSVEEVSDADAEKAAEGNESAALGVAWRQHWAKGRWTNDNLYEPKGVTKRTLAQAVSDAAKK